jgi:hypothetical protein
MTSSLPPRIAPLAAIFGLALVVAACESPGAGRTGSLDAGADGPDASFAEPDADAGPRRLANGEPCVVSAQCGGACCELHRGNTTVCAQIAPFDATQNCACAEDAAIKLCEKPGFCQESNDVTPQRFCSTACR